MRTLLLLVTCFIATAVAGLAADDASKFSQRDLRYRIHPSDVIEVDYEFTPEYNQTVAIGPDGFADLKLVGSLKLADLTVDQVTQQIKQRATLRLKDPVVTVLLKEFVKPHVTIAGEVNHPGNYDVHGKLTALELVALSGGFKDTAKQTQVLLVRKINSEVAQVRALDFRKLSTASGIQENFELLPDDLVIVPKNRIGKVEPYVRIASLGLTSLYGVTVVK